MRNTFVAFLFSLLLLSCSQRGSERKESDSTLSEFVRNDDFRTIDSVELYNYPDPKNQRQFSNANSADPRLIELLKSSLRKPSIEKTECIHYRKMYLFRNKEVFKTMYISDSCNYLAYAMNGKQVFKPLDQELKQLINEKFTEK